MVAFQQIFSCHFIAVTVLEQQKSCDRDWQPFIVSCTFYILTTSPPIPIGIVVANEWRPVEKSQNQSEELGLSVHLFCSESSLPLPCHYLRMLYRSLLRRLPTWIIATPNARLSTSPFPDLPANAPPHNSLATFIDYARRTGLSPTSTLYIGTHYEYTCKQSLIRLGFTLTRTGGRADAGIDLLGTWHLPGGGASGGSPPLRCVAQCKALARAVGPSAVREIEGAIRGAPVGWRGDRCVGVLLAAQPASRGVREAIKRSSRGLVWICVEEGQRNKQEKATQTGGRVRQLLWNDRVAEMGAAGIDVGLRRGPLQEEVVLTWQNEVWEPNEAKGVETGQE